MYTDTLTRGRSHQMRSCAQTQMERDLEKQTQEFSLHMTQICEEQPVVISFSSTADFNSHFWIFKLKFDQ